MSLDAFARGSAILAVAAGLALSGCGGSSADSDTGETARGSATTSATPSGAAAERTDADRGSSRGHQGARSAGTGKKQPPSEKRQPVSRPAHHEPERKPPGEVRKGEGCPAGVSAEECQQLAATMSKGGTGVSSGDDCPAGLTKEECRQAAAAAENENGSGSAGSGSAEECPAGVSASECRAVAEALGE